MSEWIDGSTIAVLVLVLLAIKDKALRAVLYLAFGVAGSYYLLATVHYS